MKRLALLSILLAALAAPGASHAATTLTLEGPDRVRPGEDVVYAVRARISEAINAVGFTLSYDAASVASVVFVPGDSIVRQWLRRSEENGGIRLEGIIPGGTAPVLDDSVPLGYARFRFSGPGVVTLGFADAEIYLHQPVPVQDTVTVSSKRITVSPDAASATAVAPSAPEEAYVRVLRDATLLDGRWAVVADIRDAAGPVATFLLRERRFGLFGSWRELSSPASLSDQLRMSILEVGVPDGSGVRVLYRETPVRLLVTAAFAVLIIAYTIRRRMHR